MNCLAAGHEDNHEKGGHFFFEHILFYFLPAGLATVRPEIHSVDSGPPPAPSTCLQLHIWYGNLLSEVHTDLGAVAKGPKKSRSLLPSSGALPRVKSAQFSPHPPGLSQKVKALAVSPSEPMPPGYLLQE